MSWASLWALCCGRRRAPRSTARTAQARPPLTFLVTLLPPQLEADKTRRHLVPTNAGGLCLNLALYPSKQVEGRMLMHMERCRRRRLPACRSRPSLRLRLRHHLDHARQLNRYDRLVEGTSKDASAFAFEQPDSDCTYDMSELDPAEIKAIKLWRLADVCKD